MFVLWHSGQVVETFDTRQDALKAGYLLFGLEKFLVMDFKPTYEIGSGGYGMDDFGRYCERNQIKIVG